MYKNDIKNFKMNDLFKNLKKNHFKLINCYYSIAY